MLMRSVGSCYALHRLYPNVNRYPPPIAILPPNNGHIRYMSRFSFFFLRLGLRTCNVALTKIVSFWLVLTESNKTSYARNYSLSSA